MEDWRRRRSWEDGLGSPPATLPRRRVGKPARDATPTAGWEARPRCFPGGGLGKPARDATPAAVDPAPAPPRVLSAGNGEPLARNDGSLPQTVHALQEGNRSPVALGDSPERLTREHDVLGNARRRFPSGC